MKRVLIAIFAVTLIAGTAMAQHGRGVGMGPGAGMGPGQGAGMGPGGPDHDGAFGGPAFVGSDGTLYLTKGTTDSAGTTTVQLAAVRPTGTIAWTATLPTGGRGHLVLSGSNLITVSETTATDGTVTSTLTAISTASGATVWTRTIAGRAGELIPFSGGTYAIVVTPAATTGATATRSLVAIGNDGSVLWTLAL